MISPRQRFLDYVRRVPGARPVVSPFLPKPELLVKTLRYLNLPTGEDPVDNEIRLARALDYEPMFMTDLGGLIFPPEANLSNGPVQNEAGASMSARRNVKSTLFTGNGARRLAMRV